jgi:Na+/H+-dicarboxylate symporter
MKIWVKLLIGSVIGFVAGYFLPAVPQVTEALSWLEGLAIGIGRYAVYPILVFSLTIGIYELRQDGRFWRLVLQSFLVIAGCAVFVIAAGVLVTLCFSPARIPIFFEEEAGTVTLQVADNIRDLFPSNMFSVLAGQGTYLLPVCVFAFFLATGLSSDRSYTKPIVSLLDSLSRIFYHMSAFFSEILGFVMIVLAAYWSVRFRGVLAASMFRDLIVLLGVFSLVLGFGILPLFLYLLKPKTNPWMVLYASLGPALAALFSGDINFCLPVLQRHLKENLGVRRRSNVVTLTFFSAFGRAGSAMAAAAAFIVIAKTYYSSLGIPRGDILITILRALLISFLLARHPGSGAYTALAVLCLGYGKTLEAGYLLLKSIAFYLTAIGVFLDVVICAFGSYAVARLNAFQEDKSMRHFI